MVETIKLDLNRLFSCHRTDCTSLEVISCLNHLTIYYYSIRILGFGCFLSTEGHVPSIEAKLRIRGFHHTVCDKTLHFLT